MSSTIVFAKKNLFRDLRRGQTPKSSVETDPVAFLVRFANADLTQFREGDWLNLQDDLAAFARTPLSGPMALLLEPRDQPERLPHEPTVFLGLQQAILNLLRKLAGKQSVLKTAPLHGGVVDLVNNLAVSVETSSRETAALVFSGRYLELLFIKASVVLATDASAARLRLCPECQSLFLRVRKQQYCRRACVNRANMRAWLAHPRRKESHRESSRRSYDKRTHARTSPNVRISRKERTEK